MRAKLIFLCLIFSIPLVISINSIFNKEENNNNLVFYCAAGLRLPVQEIVENYQNEFQDRINIQFAGSGTLLSNIEASNTGDLYLAADTSYIDIAIDKGFVESTIPTCNLTAGFVVKKNNPLKLKSIDDILNNPSVRVVLANPEAASIGKFSKKVLTDSDKWKSISARAVVMKPTVNEIANAVKLNSADVGIVWDAVANQYAELEFVPLPEFNEKKKLVTIGLLKSSLNKPAAMKFARYLSSKDKGQMVLKKHGFEILSGDQWELNPSIVLYTGAMLNPAIKKSLDLFEKREGVSVDVVPNGCGVLVSQMKAGARPDAYFSCDVSFMNDVEHLFSPSITISQNDMVILIKKDKVDEIKKIKDLEVPGLRVGCAHPEKSALGALTVRLLDNLKINLGSNLTLDSATGDFLVNQLRAGSLDAIIVYRSNALANSSTLDDAAIVEINDSSALAYQPFAIGLNTKHKNLMTRLFDTLTSQQAKSDFEKIGFKWMVE